MSSEAVQPDFDNIDAQAAAESAEGKPGRRRMLLLAAAGLVSVVGAGGGAAYFMGLFDGGKDLSTQAPPMFFELPEMTVNLNSTDQRAQYLRVRIALEMHGEDTRKAVVLVLPRVLDAFQVYLRELRPTDLEGSAGIYRLKEELVRRVNMAIHPAAIDSVVFKEIIVQ